MTQTGAQCGLASSKPAFAAAAAHVLAALCLLIGIGATNAFGFSTRPACPASQSLSSPRSRVLVGARPQSGPASVATSGQQSWESSDRGDDDLGILASFEDLIRQENFQEVEPLLHSYLGAHPASWRAYYFLGYVQFRQRKLSDSVKALSKSLELNTENAAAHKILGRALSTIGRYDLALREFEEALRLDPSSAEVRYNFGRVYSIQDDFPRAKKEFEKAIELDPGYMEAYNALGFVMEGLGDDAAALEDYQNAIHLNEQRHGKFDAPYVNISGYYNRRNNLELARNYAQQALELNPQSDLAYFQIAKACRTKEDWKGMAEALENAIAIKPSSSQYHYVLAIAYRKLGKIRESEQALETFRQLEKQTAELENQRRQARRATRGLELRPEE